MAAPGALPELMPSSSCIDNERARVTGWVRERRGLSCLGPAAATTATAGAVAAKSNLLARKDKTDWRESEKILYVVTL